MFEAARSVINYFGSEEVKKPDIALSRLELHFVCDKCSPSQQLWLHNKRGDRFLCERPRNSSNHYSANVTIKSDQKQVAFCLKVNDRIIEDFTVVLIPPYRCVAFACSRTDDKGAWIQFTSFVKYISLTQSYSQLVLLHALLFALKQPKAAFDVVRLMDVFDNLTGGTEGQGTFPLVAAVLVGFCSTASSSTGRVQRTLLDAPSVFPSCALLRSLSQGDLDDLRSRDHGLFDHALAGVEDLLCHSLMRAPAELVWLENISSRKFVTLSTRLTLKLLVPANVDLPPAARDRFWALVADLTASKLDELVVVLYLVCDSCRIALLHRLLVDTPRPRALELARSFLVRLAERSSKKHQFLPVLVEVAQLVAQAVDGEPAHAFSTAAQEALLLILQCPCTELAHLQASLTPAACTAVAVDAAVLKHWLAKLLTLQLQSGPSPTRPLELLCGSNLMCDLTERTAEQLLPALGQLWMRSQTRPSGSTVSGGSVVRAVMAAREVLLRTLSRLQQQWRQEAGAREAQVKLDHALQAMAVEDLRAVVLPPLGCLNLAHQLEVPGDGDDLQLLRDGVFSWQRQNLLQALDAASQGSFVRAMESLDCPLDESAALPLSRRLLAVLLDTLSQPPYAVARARGDALSYAHLAPFGELVRAVAASGSSSRAPRLGEALLRGHPFFSELLLVAEGLAQSIASGNLTLQDFAAVFARPAPLLLFSAAVGVSVTASSINSHQAAIVRFQRHLVTTRQYLNRAQERILPAYGGARAAAASCARSLEALEESGERMLLSQVAALELLGADIAALAPVADSLQSVKDSKLYLSIWERELDSAVAAQYAADGSAGSNEGNVKFEYSGDEPDEIDTAAQSDDDGGGVLGAAAALFADGTSANEVDVDVEQGDVDLFCKLCAETSAKADDQLREFVGSIVEARTSNIKVSAVTSIWTPDMYFATEVQALRAAGRFATEVESWNNHCVAAMSALTDFNHFCGELAPGLLNVLKLFGCPAESSAIATQARALVDIQVRINDVLLSELTDLIVEWRRAVAAQCGKRCSFVEMAELLVELQHCADVVAFVDEVKEERDFNLMDMVEEHAESGGVGAQTVTDFENIRRALTPLLLPTGPRVPGQEPAGLRLIPTLSSPENLLRELSEVLLKPGDNAAAKLHGCRHQIHSIKSIWNSVAQREESTKYLCRLLNREGSVTWEREGTGFRVELSCRTSDQRVEVRDQNAIEDLRSRALLLVNSASKAQLDASADASGAAEVDSALACAAEDRAAMRTFIEASRVAMEITQVLSALIEVGHFSYQMQVVLSAFTKDDLAEVLTRAESQRAHWETLLTAARAHHAGINYFFSSQLWELHCFFADVTSDAASGSAGAAGTVPGVTDSSETAVNLLWFAGAGNDRAVDSYAQCRGFYHRSEMLLEMFGSAEQDAASQLTTLARALDDIMGIGSDADLISSIAPDPLQKFQPLCYVRYDSDVKLLPALLSLYEAPDKIQRNQLLVCDSGTTREEMSMFLHRVFAVRSTAPARFACLQLHKLNHNDCAYFLQLTRKVEAKFHGVSLNMVVLVLLESEMWRIDGMQLPLLHGGVSLLDDKIRKLMKSKARNVLVVRSESSGLGKSRICGRRAQVVGKTLHKLLVVDRMTRHELVGAFSGVRLSPHEALHLDVANLTADTEGDVQLGLFELLFIGASQMGTTVARWPVQTHCFVECASTLETGNRRASVDTLRYFPCENIRFSLQELAVDADPFSDMHVVCAHLHALETNVLHSQEVILDPTAEEAEPHDARALLKKYFFDYFADTPPSFAVMALFLRVLAQQLQQFSNPDVPYYKVWLLLEDDQDPHIRCRIVESLVACSRDFAAKSVVHARQRQRGHLLYSDCANESQGLLKWEESNQLMVCLVGSSQDCSLAVLYRKLKDVDPSLLNWYNTQAGPNDELKDYFQQNSDQLRRQLNIICSGNGGPFEGHAEYVLTADNFLKCVMMLLRVKAGVPAIVMGAAGCGKTSLVRFLAAICSAQFRVLNVHAGVSRDNITDRLVGWIDEHRAMDMACPLWIFMDEINTCGELGFIKAVMCDRFLPGCHIPVNVSFFAACNPYVRRPEDGAAHIGLSLSGKAPAGRGDGLVYRVHPLVETMLDYIWDFGSLSPVDERLYIAQYLGKLRGGDRLVCTVATSQQFMRRQHGADAVSMRDVRRVKILYEWFLEHKLPSSRFLQPMRRETACIILALGHCYRCRLRSADLRQEYDEAIASELGGVIMSATMIQRCIREEQDGYLKEMKLPPGIALNHALRENVYVLLVCIVTKIPVFLVGEPGSSKSLSIVLLSSNMRGKDSESKFFRRLPEVKITAFQGSESSTSEGILKIFKKAEDYADAREAESSRRQHSVITVVLIDEIGLAEVSPSNPLKVLHSRLETADDSPLKVAVIGVSNWELDLSKMSRAVYLARVKPTAKELTETALQIVETIASPSKPPILYRIEPKLRRFSECYLSFCDEEAVGEIPNFHGLRDFYSTFKTLGQIIRDKFRDKLEVDNDDWTYALQRNFGGLTRPLRETAFREFFAHEAHMYRRISPRAKPTTFTTLVADNLRDRAARHLMLLSDSDAVLSEVGDIFTAAGVSSYRLMIGSPFKGDQTENYRYRMLSEIILCMERGESLALRDLDGIYGSLYDMLNQNYTVVAGKKNCRVALGAFSNPLARVHDDFKCIVLPETGDVGRLDPPFLNRFEKHYSRPDLGLTRDQQRMVDRMTTWIAEFCHCGKSLEHSGSCFSERDVFVGCSGTTTLCSLVLQAWHTLERDDGPVVEEEVLVHCQRQLVQVASLQGMVRAQSDSFPENEDLLARYLADEQHMSLGHFLAPKLGEGPAQSSESASGTVLTTYSSFYFLDSSALCKQGPQKVVCKSMSAFGTEQDLLGCLRSFYESTSQTVLMLQFDWSADADKLMIAKSSIQNEVVRASRDQGVLRPAKHAVLLLHLRSEVCNEACRGGYQLHHSREWDHFHIDHLQQEETSWSGVCSALRDHHSVSKFLADNQHLVTTCIEQDLISAFKPLRYTKGLETTRIRRLCAAVSPGTQSVLKTVLTELVCGHLTPDADCREDGSWIEKVAWDRGSLDLAGSSLVQAAITYARRLVNVVLTKAVYLLEQHSATDAYCAVDATPYHLSAFKHLPDLNLAAVAEAAGMEVMEVGAVVEGLRFPFSALLEKHIEKKVSSIRDEYIRARQASPSAHFDMRSRRTTAVVEVVNLVTREFVTNTWKCPSIHGHPCEALYRSDVLRLFAANAGVEHVCGALDQTVYRMLEMLGCSGSDVDPGRLHVLLWGHFDFISSMLRLLDTEEDGPKIELLTDQDRVAALCERGSLSPTESDDIMKAIVYDLAEQFCRAQWQLLRANCSDVEVLELSVLESWRRTVVAKLDHFRTVCKKAGFSFELTPPEDDETFDVLNAEMLQSFLCLESFVAVCSLIEKFGTLADSFRQELTVYVLHAPTLASDDTIGRLFELLKRLAAEMREHENAGDVRELEYRLLKKLMVLPTTDPYRNMHLPFTSSGFLHFGVVASEDPEKPASAAQDLVTMLMEELWFVYSTYDKDFQYLGACDRCKIPTELAKAFTTFDKLFTVSVTDSPLQVLMVDRLQAVVAAAMNGVDESMCRMFTAVVANLALSYDGLSLGEQVLGTAVCRWVLDESALDVLCFAQSLGDITEPLALNLMNIVLDTAKTSPVHEMMRVYFMKALKRGEDSSPEDQLSFEGMQEKCAEDGQLQRCIHWLSDYPWTADEVVTRMMPLLGPGSEELRGAAMEAWADLTARAGPSHMKCQELLEGHADHQGEAANALVAVAFCQKCRVAAPAGAACDLVPLLQTWPATASHQRRYLEAVNGRFRHPGTPPQCDIGRDALDADDIFQMLIVSSLMACNSTCFRTCPVGSYIFEPHLVPVNFMLGAHTSDAAQIRRIIMTGDNGRMQGSLNRCPCGELYQLLDCGMPGGTQRPCPGCGRMMGGQDHKWTTPGGEYNIRTDDPEQNQDPKGYAFLPDLLEVQHTTVRELNSREFRVLNVLVHCSVLVSLCAATETTQLPWCIAIGADPAAMAAAVWRNIRSSWRMLCREIQVEDDQKEQLCAFLVQIVSDLNSREIFPQPRALTTMDLRQAAEKQFCIYLRPLLENFSRHSREALDRHVETCDLASDAFRKRLLELDRPQLFLSTCFRVTRRPCFQSIRRAFDLLPDRDARYPALAAYFEQHEQLDRIQDILHLMRWTNEIRSQLNFRYDPLTTDSTAAVLREHRSSLDASMFEDFVGAWNRHHKFTAAVGHRFEIDRSEAVVRACQDPVSTALDSSCSILYSCVRAEGTGSEALLIGHALGSIQNNFLKQVFAACPALDPGAVPRVRLQEATAADLIHCPEHMHAELLRFARPSLGYGAGAEFECDWQLMEQLVRTELVQNKSLLWTAVLDDNAVLSYRYKSELFEHQAQVFARVNDMLPQLRALSSPEQMRRDPALRSAQLEAPALVETQLLPALNNVICMLLKQGKQGCLPSLTLGAFVDAHMDHATVAMFAGLRTKDSGIPELTLAHLEALYELLEDMVADTVVGSIDAKYCADLPSGLLNRVVALLQSRVDSLSNLEGCFRRFAMRYLCRPESVGGTMLPGTPLYYYLDCFRWPNGVDMTSIADESPEVEELFNELLVAHTGTVHRLLREKVTAAAQAGASRQQPASMTGALSQAQQDRVLRAAAAAEGKGGRVALSAGGSRRRPISSSSSSKATEFDY